ncbi:MAG: hypothetical protein SFW67_11295 [Myxococcaceae bacterium]|nr:hypothetical protein [Myxococcaceae bacterium]
MRVSGSLLVAVTVSLAACERGPNAGISERVTIDWARAEHEVVSSAHEVSPGLEDRASRGDLAAKDVAVGLDGALTELAKTHQTVLRELTRMGRVATEAEVAQLSARMTEAVRRVETRVGRARVLLAQEAQVPEPSGEPVR